MLDFGLAKADDPVAARSSSVSMSLTLTMPVMTQMGMILGLWWYSSPEQAKGRTVEIGARTSGAFGASCPRLISCRNISLAS